MNSYSRLASGTLGVATFQNAPDPDCRLIWFPFGGGSSRSFAPVAAHLPDSWCVHAIDAPGHAMTGGEPMRSPQALCDFYMAELGVGFFRGAVLSGQSVGGLIAALLTQMLEAEGAPARGCILGAARPPSCIRSAKLSGYDSERLFHWWLENIGQPASGRGVAELFRMLETSIRSDIDLYEAFENISLSVSRTPALVLYGEQDPVAPAAVMGGWRNHLGAISLQSTPGRHLFVIEEPEAAAAAIHTFCDEIAPRLGPTSSDLQRLALPTEGGSELLIGLLTFLPDIAHGTPEWVATFSQFRPAIEQLLADHGAVLVRGLSIESPEGLADVVARCGYKTCDYRGGNSPRKHIADGVFTSTEYPSELPISPHAELSYDQDKAPDVLFFSCIVPPEAGGETPLVDLERVVELLDGAVVDRFEKDGVLYVRRMHGGAGLGRSWQETFQSTDRSTVESILLDRGVVFDWTASEELVVRQRSPGTIVHPRRLTQVWFNQAEQWHASQGVELLGEAMEALSDPAELPHHAQYGNGDEIEADTVAHIRRTLWNNCGAFAWRRGDLLLVDNRRIGHARRPYQGQRRIIVALANAPAARVAGNDT